MEAGPLLYTHQRVFNESIKPDSVGVLGEPPIMITSVYRRWTFPGLRVPSVIASECVFTWQGSEAIHEQSHLFEVFFCGKLKQLPHRSSVISFIFFLQILLESNVLNKTRLKDHWVQSVSKATTDMNDLPAVAQEHMQYIRESIIDATSR